MSLGILCIDESISRNTVTKTILRLMRSRRHDEARHDDAESEVAPWDQAGLTG